MAAVLVGLEDGVLVHPDVRVLVRVTHEVDLQVPFGAEPIPADAALVRALACGNQIKQNIMPGCMMSQMLKKIIIQLFSFNIIKIRISFKIWSAKNKEFK